MEGDRKKILIIDDEEKIRDVYIRLFVEAGFLVRVAVDAREAINIIIREKIDLVLLDIAMPEVDGKFTYEIIQEYDPTMKVIIVSAHPEYTQKEIIPTAKDYFDKTRGALTLLNKVETILKEESSDLINAG